MQADNFALVAAVLGLTFLLAPPQLYFCFLSKFLAELQGDIGTLLEILVHCLKSMFRFRFCTVL